MKIGLVDPSLFTWPYDLMLVKALNETGHAAKVYGRNPDHAFPVDEDRYLQRHFYQWLQLRPLKLLPVKMQLALKGLSHIESMARLLMRFRAEPPDVIHFQWTPLAIVDSKFMSSFRKIAPTILTVHDSNPFNNSPSSSLQRLGTQKILTQFDHLIVHTRAARERLLAKGLAEERVSIVPHGLLMDERAVDVKAPRREDDRIQILLFGQIKPYKGVDVLLRAISLLPAEAREKCVVKIVGRPFMPMEPVYAMVDDLKLKQMVEFDLRYVPDAEVPSLIAGAGVVVFPYREIDASGVFMLALAAARPIIASRLGTFAELMDDTASPGTLISPDDPQALSNSLHRLIVDPLHRETESRKIAALRDSVPTWTEIAVLTVETYKKAMSRRPEKT